MLAGIEAVQLLIDRRPGAATLAHKVAVGILESEALHYMPSASRGLLRIRLEEATKGWKFVPQAVILPLRHHWAGTVFCSGCGKAFRYLLMCSGCRTHMLCSSQCHKASWPQLRAECRRQQQQRQQQQRQEEEEGE